LTPKVSGKIGIIITLYQEEDSLGSTRVQTLVTEQEAGQVKVEIQSEDFAPKRDEIYSAAQQRTDLQRELAQHQQNLLLLRQQKAQYGAGEEPLHLLNQIDYENGSIQQIQGELAS
jgi:hypothetical protein